MCSTAPVRKAGALMYQNDSLPFKVIQGHRFGYQSKARIHIPIGGLGPYLAPFQKYYALNVENRNFPYLTTVPAKIWGSRS